MVEFLADWETSERLRPMLCALAIANSHASATRASTATVVPPIIKPLGP